jgi:hypothetical protein
MKYKELKQRIRAYQDMLGVANATVHKQMQHIEMLNRQLEQQDHAIIRKDMQFEGLKACYKDDLINGRLG